MWAGRAPSQAAVVSQAAQGSQAGKWRRAGVGGGLLLPRPSPPCARFPALGSRGGWGREGRGGGGLGSRPDPPRPRPLPLAAGVGEPQPASGLLQPDPGRGGRGRGRRRRGRAGGLGFRESRWEERGKSRCRRFPRAGRARRPPSAPPASCRLLPRSAARARGRGHLGHRPPRTLGMPRRPRARIASGLASQVWHRMDVCSHPGVPVTRKRLSPGGVFPAQTDQNLLQPNCSPP